MMPRLDGWAVLRALREEGLTPNIPVVLISGSDVLDEETARELGAAAVLPKPFQMATIGALVQELVKLPALLPRTMGRALFAQQLLHSLQQRSGHERLSEPAIGARHQRVPLYVFGLHAAHQ
jgi:CheY-like chemotaxis protein